MNGHSGFGLSGGSQEAQQGPVLADCPCGEQAAWYRVDGNAAAPDQDGGRSEKAYSDIALDGLPSSLCAQCFLDAVPEAQRDRWKRIELTEGQKEQRWSNQERASNRGWGDNQDTGEWD